VRSCGQLSRPPRVRPIAPPRVSRSGSRTRGRRLPEPSGPTAPGPTHPPTARRPPRGCAPTRAGSAVGRASSSRVRRTGPRVVAAAAAASRQPDGEEIGRALHDRGTHARRRARGAWREATAFVDTASRRSDSRSGPAQAGARRLAAPPRSSSRPRAVPLPERRTTRARLRSISSWGNGRWARAPSRRREGAWNGRGTGTQRARLRLRSNPRHARPVGAGAPLAGRRRFDARARRRSSPPRPPRGPRYT
jgi:hypothetical protein